MRSMVWWVVEVLRGEQASRLESAYEAYLRTKDVYKELTSSSSRKTDDLLYLAFQRKIGQLQRSRQQDASHLQDLSWLRLMRADLQYPVLFRILLASELNEEEV